MLTPQEVSARSFTKTMMGGYNMTMVDEFLDELTDDYTSLYKENASLKAKMKVLVEKVEEYRATEDSMRATLLTAQRMADSIIKEAEEKRDGILQQAEAAAREKLDGYRREAEQCAKRLQQGQDEIQRFVAESRALCEKELRFLEEFPAMLLEESEPVSAAAEEIGEKILSAGEPAPAPAPTVAEGDYVVKSGDCLWSIAQKAYGTGRQWQVIYNANKDAIKNPNDLRVGQVLVIPAA